MYRYREREEFHPYRLSPLVSLTHRVQLLSDPNKGGALGELLQFACPHVGAGRAQPPQNVLCGGKGGKGGVGKWGKVGGKEGGKGGKQRKENVHGRGGGGGSTW